MARNAIADLVRETNLLSLPLEFRPDYEDMGELEATSLLPSPLDYLLEREDGFVQKTETRENLCVLPSSFFRNSLGTYAIFSPLVNPCAAREGVRAYVSPESPKPRFRDDCYEILPKFVPLRRLHKFSGNERGGQRRHWKSQMVIIGKLPPLI